MQTFIWNDVFLTGLTDVDTQHHKLVDLINELGDLLAEDKPPMEDLKLILGELIDYTGYHFREEEQLAARAGVDPRHQKRHQQEHAHFVQEILDSGSDLTDDDASREALNGLLQFLSHWLAYHILGSDQNLARQIAAIEKGASPAQAFEDEEKRSSDSTEPLLRALDGLFRQVSQRNRALRQLNQELEEKVAARTRALREANMQLDQMAHTDALTQLPNRRGALEILEQAWVETLQRGTALSLMMLDADYFKEVNDRHGHEEGDRVLKAIAEKLQAASRAQDFACRLGGDEFLMICLDTQLAEALDRAEGIRRFLAELTVATGSGEWTGSMSIGVAARDSSVSDAMALLKKADQSVYEAKRVGKNCVRSVQAYMSITEPARTQKPTLTPRKPPRQQPPS
jgi:hemerythrin